jgi:hypothetical protein
LTKLRRGNALQRASVRNRLASAEKKHALFRAMDGSVTNAIHAAGQRFTQIQTSEGET